MTNISIGKKTLATATLISGVAGFNSANRCKPSVCRNTNSRTLNMKRPKTLFLAWLLALLCLASTGLARAEQVSIGDPETTSNSIYIPWYSNYDYSYTQQIYTAEEIGRAGVINSLTVWLYHGGNPNNEPLPTFNIDIYMKEVSKDAFSGTTDWVSVSSSDKVYTGTLTVANTTARAFTFTFDKSFTYSGQGNLLIAFDDNTGSYKYGLRGLVFSGSSDPNRTIYAFRDGTDYNPTSMSGVTANNTTYQRNVIELGMYDENLSYNQSITIGDLATASNSPRFPWHSNYDYSYTQQIYTADEIGTSGTINAVTMWLVNTGNSNNEPLPTFNIDIYMKEVDKETFSGSNDWVSVSADDKVYCGSVKVTNTNAQAFTFTLATPFEYSGQGNLLIAFDDNTGSYKYGMNGRVFGESNDPIRAVYCCRDGSDYDPFNMTGITSTTLAQRNVVALSMTDCPALPGLSTVTIGDPESTASHSVLPMTSTFNYSYTQQIFTAEEIGTVCTVNTLTMWLRNNSTNILPTLVFDIYMREVDKDAFTGLTDWVSVSATDKVYSGTLTVTNRAFQSYTITLDTPFEYSGQGNLLIAFDENTGYWKSGLEGKVSGTEGAPIRTIYARRDGSDYDPLNISGVLASGTPYQRNVVEFGIVPAPSTLTVYDGTATNWQIPAYFSDFDAFTKSQFVIPADDLMEMEGGTISSMKFYIPDIWYFTTNCPVDVYVMEVDYTTINAYEPKANAAIVYQGSLTVNQVGYSAELTVNFTEPYQYLGGNLLVGMENTETGSDYNCGFYGTTVDGASISGYSYSLDGYFPPTQRNFIPKTTFTYQIADLSGCGRPMTLVAQYISNNGATIAWTGGSGTYNVETKTGNGDWTRVCSDLGANTYTFENLKESTEYRVRVQSVCGDEVSGWKAVTFTTLCGPVTVTTDMAYTENFESPAGTGWQSQGPLPDCWRAYSTGDIAPHNLSGDNQKLVIVGNGDNYAILPKFSNPISELQIRFLSRAFNGVSQLELGYLTAGDDGTCNTFTNIASYEIYWNYGNYLHFTTDLQSVPSEAVQLAFRFNDDGKECYIDDVEVAIPCTEPEPEALVVTNATVSSVTLDWTPAEGPSAWDLYLSQDYNDIPNDETVPTVANVTTHPYTIDTGLNFTATCVPYVRTRCGAMSHSAWVRSNSSFGIPCDEPITVTTDMAYTEDFGSPAGTHWQSQGPLPDCWRTYSTGNPAPHIQNVENQNLVIVGDGDNYAILPKFSNPISELQISFLSRTFNGVSQLELGYLTAGDDGTCNTFTNIASYEIYWNYGNYLQFTTALQSVPAEAVQLAFRFNDDGQECYIDDVEVAYSPAVIAPHNIAAVNLTNHTADITWEGLCDSYALRYRDAAIFSEGFEGGTMPQGWTIEGDSQDPANTWRVGIGDYRPGIGTHSGSYNALITHNTSNQVTYFVTPAINLGGYDYAELSFWYINRVWSGCFDHFAVCYRIGNEGEWNELWSTTVNHEGWTSQTVDLTGLADNCQIGFRYTDHYGFGVGLDDIAINIVENTEWITVGNAQSPHTLTGLTPETEYEVQLQGTLGSTVFDWSASIYFTTPDMSVSTQTIELVSGWNWVSFNVETTLDDLKAALVEALPGTAISIKSQTQNTSYNPNNHRWVGSLAWDVAKMYMIKVVGPCEITIEGMPINPAEHPVSILNGANWIGFPLNSSITLSNAFADFAANGDRIKSQTNNALYNGIRWQGQLNTLVPNSGYIYISNSEEERTFIFPISTR